MKNKVLILGAGIGVMTIGFENAGCRVVAAYEKNKKALELYRKNVNKEVDEYEDFFTCAPEKSGKLILCLSDEDLKELLRIKEKDEQPTADWFRFILVYGIPVGIPYMFICLSLYQGDGVYLEQ